MTTEETRTLESPATEPVKTMRRKTKKKKKKDLFIYVCQACAQHGQFFEAFPDLENELLITCDYCGKSVCVQEKRIIKNKKYSSDDTKKSV